MDHCFSLTCSGSWSYQFWPSRTGTTASSLMTAQKNKKWAEVQSESHGCAKEFQTVVRKENPADSCWGGDAREDQISVFRRGQPQTLSCVPLLLCLCGVYVLNVLTHVSGGALTGHKRSSLWNSFSPLHPHIHPCTTIVVRTEPD